MYILNQKTDEIRSHLFRNIKADNVLNNAYFTGTLNNAMNGKGRKLTEYITNVLGFVYLSSLVSPILSSFHKLYRNQIANAAINAYYTSDIE